jgi:hypothetical protein
MPTRLRNFRDIIPGSLIKRQGLYVNNRNKFKCSLNLSRKKNIISLYQTIIPRCDKTLEKKAEIITNR